MDPIRAVLKRSGVSQNYSGNSLLRLENPRGRDRQHLMAMTRIFRAVGSVENTIGNNCQSFLPGQTNGLRQDEIPTAD